MPDMSEPLAVYKKKRAEADKSIDLFLAIRTWGFD